MVASIAELTLGRELTAADTAATVKALAIRQARGVMARGTMEQRARGTVPVQDGVVWERPDEYRLGIYVTAWLKSLERARHRAYLRHHVCVPPGGLPEGGVLLDDDQHPQALAYWVKRIAAGQETKQHLIAFGNVGSGKTAAAIALGSLAVQAGIMTRYVRHGDYVRWLRPDGAPAGLTALQVREFHDRCKLLILDELCGEMDGQATEAVRQATGDLLSARIASGLPTVIATNLHSAQIAKVLGDRIVSRLGESAMALEFLRPDRREPVRW
ncbi:ATP-binding protein [Streptomyces sp. MJM8645]|uniref:ATP-binding protein n=1 Tax=Streptomycetaceae TaxID=2062 RepID=UPI000A8B168B|nr:ATP-binding protein [Streptomyces sp. MJM8645]